MKRKLSFERACRTYVNRYTMEHIPQWATKGCVASGQLRHYAPQFRTDREWYDNTRFPGESGHHGIGTDCYTSGQTWPLGKWLDAPYSAPKRSGGG
jgi:hypothetical protein